LSLFRYIFSKYFWANLLVAILVFLLLGWLSLKALAVYTRHGKYIEVPDLSGLSFDQAKEELEKRDLRFHIMDSSYVEEKQPHEVLFHTPAAGEKVKKNRTIYLSINMTTAPRIKMPKLVDNSLKNAQNILRLKGLKYGGKTIRPFKFDYVVGQLYNGKPIETGEEVPQGAKIFLIVGSGTGSEKFPAPSLYGLTIEDAENVLKEYSLDIYPMGFDGEVTDSMNAVIVRQSPSPYSSRMVTFGDVIEVWRGDASQIDFPNDSVNLIDSIH